MNRSWIALLFSAALAAQSAQTPVQELKPPPLPPPTAPTDQAPAQAPTSAAPHHEHTPPKLLPPADQAALGTPAPATSSASLSFASGSFKFYWDTTLPMNLEADGLKVTEIYFNVRKSRYSWLKDAEFGTRAHVTVTNTSARPRTPGFAVAVLDADGKLLGVASGGTKVGTVAPGGTEEFDLNFTQVKERLPKGATFLLSMELRD